MLVNSVPAVKITKQASSVPHNSDRLKPLNVKVVRWFPPNPPRGLVADDDTSAPLPFATSIVGWMVPVSTLAAE